MSIGVNLVVRDTARASGKVDVVYDAPVLGYRRKAERASVKNRRCSEESGVRISQRATEMYCVEGNRLDRLNVVVWASESSSDVHR